MTAADPPYKSPPIPLPAPSDGETRLAAALRANLRRRKAKAPERSMPDD